MRLQWYFKVLASVFALASIILLLLVWWAYGTSQQEVATAQEQTAPALATVSPDSPAEVTVPAQVNAPEVEPSETRPEVIPGLSVMDVIGQLNHFLNEGSEGEFVCDGPTPTTQGRGSLRKCAAPGGESAGTYEVTVLSNGPLGVMWVVATARGVSEERAAQFFTHVADQCLQDTDPLNPRAWVEQNVSPGGQVIAGSSELTIYGTEAERTLQLVPTGFTAD